MSIIRFINGRNRELSQLKQILAYVQNSEKNPQGYQGAMGVDINTAYEDMLAMKALHNKTNGRQYIHFVLSFDVGTHEKLAFQIAQQSMQYYRRKFQYVFSCHNNTSNFHMHAILNSVGVNGKKFSQGPGDLYRFRDYVNTILKSYEMSLIGKPEEIDFSQMDAEEWDKKRSFAVCNKSNHFSFEDDDSYECEESWEDESSYDEEELPEEIAIPDMILPEEDNSYPQIVYDDAIIYCADQAIKASMKENVFSFQEGELDGMVAPIIKLSDSFKNSPEGLAYGQELRNRANQAVQSILQEDMSENEELEGMIAPVVMLSDSFKNSQEGQAYKRELERRMDEAITKIHREKESISLKNVGEMVNHMDLSFDEQINFLETKDINCPGQNSANIPKFKQKSNWLDIVLKRRE